MTKTRPRHEFCRSGTQQRGMERCPCVVRSEFDRLLDHASSLGTKVYKNTKVVSLGFDQDNAPVSAAYTCRSSDTGNTVNGISFNYLIDATGRAGLMSTKYLKNCNFTESLKNIAVWGHWAGVGSYGEGTIVRSADRYRLRFCGPIPVACKLMPAL